MEGKKFSTYDRVSFDKRYEYAVVGWSKGMQMWLLEAASVKNPGWTVERADDLAKALLFGYNLVFFTDNYYWAMEDQLELVAPDIVDSPLKSSTGERKAEKFHKYQKVLFDGKWVMQFVQKEEPEEDDDDQEFILEIGQDYDVEEREDGNVSRESWQADEGYRPITVDYDWKTTNRYIWAEPQDIEPWIEAKMVAATPPENATNAEYQFKAGEVVTLYQKKRYPSYSRPIGDSFLIDHVSNYGSYSQSVAYSIKSSYYGEGAYFEDLRLATAEEALKAGLKHGEELVKTAVKNTNAPSYPPMYGLGALVRVISQDEDKLKKGVKPSFGANEYERIMGIEGKEGKVTKYQWDAKAADYYYNIDSYSQSTIAEYALKPILVPADKFIDKEKPSELKFQEPKFFIGDKIKIISQDADTRKVGVRSAGIKDVGYFQVMGIAGYSGIIKSVIWDDKIKEHYYSLDTGYTVAEYALILVKRAEPKKEATQTSDGTFKVGDIIIIQDTESGAGSADLGSVRRLTEYVPEGYIGDRIVDKVNTYENRRFNWKIDKPLTFSKYPQIGAAGFRLAMIEEIAKAGYLLTDGTITVNGENSGELRLDEGISIDDIMGGSFKKD